MFVYTVTESRRIDTLPVKATRTGTSLCVYQPFNYTRDTCGVHRKKKRVEGPVLAALVRPTDTRLASPHVLGRGGLLRLGRKV